MHQEQFVLLTVEQPAHLRLGAPCTWHALAPCALRAPGSTLLSALSAFVLLTLQGVRSQL